MANEVLCDCWIIQGQLDSENFTQYVKNDKYKVSKELHNVTEEEAKEWYSSLDTWQKIEDIEYSDPTIHVSHFITVASEED